MKYNSYMLQDVCDFIDYRGKTPKKTKSGVPLVTAKIIKNGVIMTPQEFIAEDNYDEWMRRGIPQKGDIVFTTEAPLGEVAEIKTDEKLAFAQRVIIMEPKKEYLNNHYLLYALQDKKLKNRIAARASGTTVIGIRSAELKKIIIDLPTIEIQEKISDILYLLDEKIALNVAINDNLEEQLLAYYNELFITNAKPAWKAGTVADLGNVVGGSTPSKKKTEYYTDHGIAWITPKDLSNNRSKFIAHGEIDITEQGLANSSTVRMPSGTVLFSSRAPIGYIAIADGEVTTNQGFKSVVPFDEIGTAFVYCFLKENLTIIENMASGSTFKEISGSTMKVVPAIIPDFDTLSLFRDYADAIFNQQRNNEAENGRLSVIRDSLLPRLMSGELDVSNLDL